MKIAWFGGSFDPVHIGHLWIAAAAVETLGLDRLFFLPAATSPLKPNGPIANDSLRIEMLHLAIGGNQAFALDDRELTRGSVSFSVDTLQEIRQEFADHEIYFVIGGDSLVDFPRWKDPAQILRLASLACVRRGGQGALQYERLQPYADTDAIAKIRGNELQMPIIEISSRQIRDRIAASRSIRYFVPAAVQELILNKNLYADPPLS